MKKILFFVLLMAYGIAFAANKTLEKTVGYDYDATLAFSTPTFTAEQEEEPSDRIDWDLVNGRLLNLEKKKHIALTVPFFKALGYTPIVITSRREIKADLFRAHVEQVYGIKARDVYMSREKAVHLRKRNCVLFFGDSDGDITEARKAEVRAVRVKRSADDAYRAQYHPGKYGEFVLPFSDGHF